MVVELRQQLLQRGENITSGDAETEWVFKDGSVSHHSDTLSDVSVKILSNTSESDIEDNYVADADTDADSCHEVPLPPPLSAWIPAVPITDDKFCAVSTNVDNNCTIYLHSFKQSGYFLSPS